MWNTYVLAILALNVSFVACIRPGDDSGEVVLGPCDGENEQEPNNTRDQAIAITTEDEIVGCIPDAEDLDSFLLKAPSNPAGGYFTVQLRNKSLTARQQLKVYTVEGSHEIKLFYVANDGDDLTAHFAVAPDTEYRVEVGNFGLGSEFPHGYELTSSFTAINDLYEPNDVREEAKNIDLNTLLKPYLFAVYVDGNEPYGEDFDDWFKFTLVAGDVEVRVDEVPTNARMVIQLLDASFQEVEFIVYSTNEGASIDHIFVGVPAGEYYLRVGQFGTQPPPSASGSNVSVSEDPPVNFTASYELRVLQ